MKTGGGGEVSKGERAQKGSKESEAPERFKCFSQG